MTDIMTDRPGTMSFVSPQEEALYKALLRSIKQHTKCADALAYRALDPVFRGIWLRATGQSLPEALANHRRAMEGKTP